MESSSPRSKGAEYQAAYRSRNPAKAREQNRISAARARRKQPERKRLMAKASVKKARERKRDIINAAKRQPCADCRRSFSYYVMDLDHVRGDKVCNVSLMVSMGFSDEEIETEIAKCDAVCSNCHRERTYQRKLAASSSAPSGRPYSSESGGGIQDLFACMAVTLSDEYGNPL